MLNEILKNHKLILASGSPRRHQFFKDLGLAFTVRTKDVDEVYPDQLQGAEISDYLAQLKANAQKDTLEPNEILITSDTVVLLDDECLGKPKDRDEALAMIRSLSGRSHRVVTSVCFSSIEKQITENCTTKVSFKDLSDTEIAYYVDHYKPYDKAGAYGIQEWIGATAITHIEGSYNNVMGLPTHLVYNILSNWD
ncbi:Maf-like protein [Sediminicola luteus]|uniref:dTTP/UTP pyrophosphatase n=1 Tax=Sediminicola luteus TaxID=319238 RepID=A0A2A4G579_9FLAO|nr:Maf-like protein [Sediminicola luteus]PCE64119.1 septum formation protein Maf [Sediminicola luteus]